MDRVKGPERPAVKEAMHPIAKSVCQEQNFEGLQPPRLAGQRTVTRQERFHVAEVDTPAKQAGHRNQRDGHCRATECSGHKRCKEPKCDVGPDGAVGPSPGAAGRFPLHETEESG